MAISDPTMSVPTPTGVLQGVAAFNWDGAAWQPTGRAGPSVATPTGVLQGVAAFTGGPSWAPSGRSGPGVPTLTGVLDGVAVYTWSGSQWTPPGGSPAPSTPSGALRGVAAFDWDGTAWQPAGQAGPDVATPYGVLQGVARFGWTGSAWAAVGAPSLSLDFMTPGALDSRITFTRASTATYTDASGVIQTAAINAPRWDYDPVTHAMRGLLIEEARTNTTQWSGDLSHAPWAPAATGAAPVVTGNNVLAPDGTLTAARIVMPAVPAGANAAFVAANTLAGAVQTTFSVWLRGAVGGEIVNVSATNFTVYAHTTAVLTTAWQRFTLTATPASAGCSFLVGTDMRDATQTPTPVETFYAWGAQSEAGAFATSYISTTAAAVTRAIDQCALPFGSWFVSPGGSWFVEFVYSTPAPTNSRVIAAANTGGSFTPLFITPPGVTAGQYDGATALNTVNTLSNNSVVKVASTWAVGQAKICANGGAVATSAALTNGYPSIVANGVFFMTPVAAGSSDNVSGYLRRVQYWPRALSDVEMQAVTR